ncbi:hypothetical protein SS50377_21089 [Spironucleus salmonicida]|uniref:Uncharacterized protein n=1 Tax=Spironucleus salmonicida TaxID=348837 RepID=A0A9P8M0K1_9EUKA|nr:hypothetical protein SS50377_21089 [Spironucleus salmonicida]
MIILEKYNIFIILYNKLTIYMLSFTSKSIKLYSYDQKLIINKCIDLISIETYGFQCTAAVLNNQAIIYSLTDGYTTYFYKFEDNQDLLILNCQCLTPTSIFYQNIPQILIFSTSAGTFYYADTVLREFQPQKLLSLKLYSNQFIIAVDSINYYIINTLSGKTFSTSLESVFLNFGESPLIITSRFFIYVDLKAFNTFQNKDLFIKIISIVYSDKINNQLYQLSNRIYQKQTFKFLQGQGKNINQKNLALALVDNNEFCIIFTIQGIKISVENVISIPRSFNGRKLFIFDNISIYSVDYDGYCHFCGNVFYKERDIKGVNYDLGFNSVINSLVERVQIGQDSKQTLKQNGNPQKKVIKDLQYVDFSSNLENDDIFFDTILRKPAINNNSVIGDRIYKSLRNDQRKELKDQYVADQLDQIYCNFDQYKKIMNAKTVYK